VAEKGPGKNLGKEQREGSAIGGRCKLERAPETSKSERPARKGDVITGGEHQPTRRGIPASKPTIPHQGYDNGNCLGKERSLRKEHSGRHGAAATAKMAHDWKRIRNLETAMY